MVALNEFVIYKRVGGFYIPDQIADYLSLKKGWKIHTKFTAEKRKKELSLVSGIYYNNCDSDLWFRGHPDVIEAFKYYGCDGTEFKIVEIPVTYTHDKLVIVEFENGIECIKEKARYWS